MAGAPARAVPIVEKRLVARRPRDREHLIQAEIDQLIDAARSTRWACATRHCC
jgi:hypothetical protein